MRRAVALVGVALGLAGAPSSASPDRARPSRALALTPVSLAFPTPDDGWVLARRGLSGAELMATHDGGASWVTQWSGALDPSEVVAADPDHAWVLGQRCAAETCASVLLGTNDAGAHWSALGSLTLFTAPPLALRVQQVAFASPTLGLAGARDASCRDRATGPPPACPGWILKTADGGLHWQLAWKSPEPIVAVAGGAGAMWALTASPGGDKPGLGAYPPSLSVLSSRDGGRSWTVRGAVHPAMSAGLRVDAHIAATPIGRLWLTALDRQTCAMHGCGVDGAWSSGDGGRRWRPVGLADPFERGVGMPCGYDNPLVAGGTVAVSFDSQDCAGPTAALYRLDGSHSRPIHVWRSFIPAALAWPSTTAGYAIGTDPAGRGIIEVTVDGGRHWHAVKDGS